MEVIYPEDKGYKGFFLVGFRKYLDNTQNETKRTGTIILKRIYDINPVTGILTPSKTPLPLFIKDQPDNLVINSSFESADDQGKPIDWHPDGVTITLDNHLLRVSGAVNGRVVQTITLDESLGGRQFTFSLSAKADDASARIESVQLEAGGHSICSIRGDLGTTMSRFTASGTWPADLEATEMRVVLRMATDSGRTIWYDKVQVEERSYQTRWDPETTLRYEHDLAPYKPEGDVIVLGFTDVAGRCLVKVDENIWLERDLGDSDREKALFGWEPRVGKARNEEVGDFQIEKDAEGNFLIPDDYPPKWPEGDPLPVDFKNRFYNGYRRSFAVYPSAAAPLLPYIPRGAQIKIEREIEDDITVAYSFTLRPDTASAIYYYNGTGLDEESNWLSGNVTMNLDTLVIEPEKNLCYVVWRGVWLFDEHYESDYRRLVVKVSD